MINITDLFQYIWHCRHLRDKKCRIMMVKHIKDDEYSKHHDACNYDIFLVKGTMVILICSQKYEIQIEILPENGQHTYRLHLLPKLEFCHSADQTTIMLQMIMIHYSTNFFIMVLSFENIKVQVARTWRHSGYLEHQIYKNAIKPLKTDIPWDRHLFKTDTFTCLGRP